MGNAGHITDDYRAMLEHYIMQDSSKDVLLAILKVIPSCPSACAPFEPVIAKIDSIKANSIYKSSIKPLERPLRHPPVKSWPDGELLADTIHSFAIYHEPQLKYTGMHTAIDVLTACRSPEGESYNFHYEIKAYKPNDGVYIQRVSGQGYRTSAEDTDNIERGLLDN